MHYDTFTSLKISVSGHALIEEDAKQMKLKKHRPGGGSSPFPSYFEKLDIAITKTLFQFASDATGKCDLPIMWTMTFSSNNFLFASHVLINLSLIPAIQFGSYSFVH